MNKSEQQGSENSTDSIHGDSTHSFADRFRYSPKLSGIPAIQKLQDQTYFQLQSKQSKELLVPINEA